LIARLRKICSQCSNVYPATTEFFHVASSIACGLRAACKSCTALKNKRYWKTVNGKAVIKRYQQSERGKTMSQLGQRRRHLTVEGYLRNVLKGIRQRCYNPNVAIYKYYGGRGIECKFTSSRDFIDWVVNVLQVDPRGLDCDRIDDNGHYEKGNIQFITHGDNIRKIRRKF